MDFFVYIRRMLNGGRITKMLKRDISNMLGYVTEDLILTIGFKKKWISIFNKYDIYELDSITIKFNEKDNSIILDGLIINERYKFIEELNIIKRKLKIISITGN